MTTIHASCEPHFKGISFQDRITLRHVKLDEGDRPCTAVEDIAALARRPNSWMHETEIDECRAFAGTEAEAVELRQRLELACSGRLAGWRRWS
jgi:hypothetical protein